MQVRRIPAHGDAIGYDGLTALFKGILHHKRIAGIEHGNHCLDTCIAKILQLLVIGTIHIGLVSTQAGRTPTDGKHLVQFGKCRCREGNILFERITRKSAVQVVHHQRLIGGGDGKLHIAPGTPPQGGERTAVATVGQEPVFVTDHLFTFDAVSVSFYRETIGFGSLIHLIFVHGLSIGNPYLRPFSFAEQQGEVAGSKLFLIQQQHRFGMCRYM